MAPRIYERVTTACLLLSIASALLFEHSGNLNWLTGSVGLAAGLVAAVAYFRNQWHELPVRTVAHQEDVESGGTPLVLTDHDTSSFEHGEANIRVVQLFEPEIVDSWSSLPIICEVKQSQELDVVARVVKIVQRLSTPENMRAFEFILSPEGNFTIRPMMHRHNPPIKDQLDAATEESLPEFESFRLN
jgi:hypothetical protein